MTPSKAGSSFGFVTRRIDMKYSPSRVGLRFGPRSHHHGLGYGPSGLAGQAVWIRHNEPSLIFCIGLQIQDAAREHIRRDDVEDTLILVDPFALQAQKGQSAFPLRISTLTVRHLHLRIPVIVAFDQPFKAKVDQGRVIDDELTWLDSVAVIGSADGGVPSQQAKRKHRGNHDRMSGEVVRVGPSYHIRAMIERLICHLGWPQKYFKMGVLRKKKIRRYAALHEPVFVMQAAEHGSLHDSVSDRQLVSVLVGRDLVCRWLGRPGPNAECGLPRL